MIQTSNTYTNDCCAMAVPSAPGLVTALQRNTELICEIEARLQEVRIVLMGPENGADAHKPPESVIGELMSQGERLQTIISQLSGLQERLR